MNSYKNRLNKVIPGGAHTYSRGSDQFPINAPQILTKGKGCYVWCNNKKYLDYGMGLRAVTIGYSNNQINKGAIKNINLGNCLSKPSVTELKAAEQIVNLIDSFDMVKFAKNGSNATTAAVKIARAYTNKDIICVPKEQPFFSFDDWFIGSTNISRGIPKKINNLTKVFKYGDISSLKKIFIENKNNIACVILEPSTFLTPCDNVCSNILSSRNMCKSCPSNKKNFLHEVRKICDKNSTLLIFDEIITGFRWHLKGAQYYFNVKPDISTFGKGMANGFSLAAVGGKKEIMQVGSITKKGAERTFLLSSTFGAEMSSLGAFLECLKIYKKNNVCNHLWHFGALLRKGLTEITDSLKISDYFYIQGPDICMNYQTLDRNRVFSYEMKTLFMQEMLKYNILMPYISLSFSHGESEIKKTLDAAYYALKIYKSALEYGVNKYLKGPSVLPVFRKYN